MTAPIAAEHRQRGANRVVGAEKVDLDEPADLVWLDRVDRAVNPETSVANQDIETAESIGRGADKIPHLGFAGDIGDKRHRLPAGTNNFGGHFREPIAAARANGDVSAVSRDAQRGGASDSGGRTGDRDDLRHSWAGRIVPESGSDAPEGGAGTGSRRNARSA